MYRTSKIMEKIGTFFIIIFVIFNLSHAEEGSVSINTKIDTTLATIGDQIHFSITLNYPEKTKFQLPEFKEVLGKFILLNQEFSKPQKTDFGFTKDINLTITVFDTGKIEIPAIPINAISVIDTNEILKFHTDSYFINVISVLPPEQVELKDIKPPFPIRKLIPWDILLFILFFISIIIIWYFYNKKWKRMHPNIIYDEQYLDPPHIVAIRKLKILYNKKFTNEIEKIEYFVGVSHIFREYLERQFFIRALEMSTTDIIKSLNSIKRKNLDISKINNLLSQLDIVKFANQIPNSEDKEKVYENTITLINDTKIDHFLSQRSGLTEIKENIQ